ncbi:MAG TPA: Flp family type IVb pilin [Fimbriiglobus sp.]|nr:Flp family type IVb pilin [Fimbriiglobus sp.]
MNMFASWVLRFARREEAATLVEYALLVVLIAVVAVAGVSALGISIQGLYNSLNQMNP